jgi:hypothetical protein
LLWITHDIHNDRRALMEMKGSLFMKSKGFCKKIAMYKINNNNNNK